MPRKSKPKELDPATAKVEAVGHAIKDLVGSSGWAEARKRLIRKVAELQMTTSMDIQSATPETIIQVIASKNTAAKILTDWLRDIEGSAEQYDGNSELIQKEVEGILMNEE